jgi:hypothetical protein
MTHIRACGVLIAVAATKEHARRGIAATPAVTIPALALGLRPSEDTI